MRLVVRGRVPLASLLVLLGVLLRRLCVQGPVLSTCQLQIRSHFVLPFSNRQNALLLTFCAVRILLLSPLKLAEFCKVGEDVMKQNCLIRQIAVLNNRSSLSPNAMRHCHVQIFSKRSQKDSRWYKTHVSFFCDHSRSARTSRASRMPSANRLRALERRACAFACSSMSSRCLSFRRPDLRSISKLPRRDALFSKRLFYVFCFLVL